eukprot:5641791-Pleurochrysis_carterae.AAC.1
MSSLISATRFPSLLPSSTDSSASELPTMRRRLLAAVAVLICPVDLFLYAFAKCRPACVPLSHHHPRRRRWRRHRRRSLAHELAEPASSRCCVASECASAGAARTAAK